MNSKSLHSSKHCGSSMATDVQFELSRCFMNYARDQIMGKELQLMMESNLLIQTLAQKINSKSYDAADKQSLNINISNTLDTLLTEQDEQPKIKAKPFSRKTVNGPQLQTKSIVIDTSIKGALEDIKENCTRKTFNTVNSLLENYNKIRKNQIDASSQSHSMSSKFLLNKSRADTDRNNSDQAIILAAKIVKLQKQNSLMMEKVKQLEKKNGSLAEQVQQSKNHLSNIQIKQEKSFNRLNIGHQVFEKKTQNFHNRIIQVIQTTFIDQGCSKCCALLKKVKDSLISYKNSLAEQINQYEQLCQHFTKGEAIKR